MADKSTVISNWLPSFYNLKSPSFSWGVRLKATPYTKATRQGGFSSTLWTQTNVQYVHYHIVSTIWSIISSGLPSIVAKSSIQTRSPLNWEGSLNPSASGSIGKSWSWTSKWTTSISVSFSPPETQYPMPCRSSKANPQPGWRRRSKEPMDSMKKNPFGPEATLSQPLVLMKISSEGM